MKKTIERNTILFLFSIILSYIVMGVIRLTNGYSIFSEYWYSDIFCLLILWAPVLLFKTRKGVRIYSYAMFAVMMFVYFADMTYYVSFGTFMHFGLLNFKKEGATAFDWSYLKPSVFLTTFLFTALYSSVVEASVRLLSSKEKFNNFYYAVSGLAALILIIVGVLGEVMTNKKILSNNKALARSAGISDGASLSNFLVAYLRQSAFEDFGVLTFYRSDIAVNVFNVSVVSGNGNGEVSVDPDDIDKELKIDSPLEATGLLEGYNVFTIMIETGMYDFITEEFTPNLYSMMSGGLNFSNNYSKNKTATSEIIGITGSFPVNGINYNYTRGTEECIYDLRIDTPYALTNMLGDSYYKSFFHDGAGLYARDSLLGQFGFDSWKHEFYSVHPSGTQRWDFNGSYEMDSDYIDIVLSDMYRTDKNFYTFWTTLSTHGPYESYSGEKNETAFQEKLDLFEKRGYTARYEEKFEEVYVSKYGEMDEKYYSYLKYVVCAMMDLDVAVGKIVDRLKEEGLFDNTLFIIYGDHEAYYHKSSDNTGLAAAMSGATTIYDVRQYHTALIMYNETLSKAYRNAYGLGEDEECRIDTFTSPYIIVPTVLDLLGIEYNEEYYYSPSFFKFETIYDGIFYCSEHSGFFTDEFFTIAPGKYSFMNTVLTEQQAELIEQIVTKQLLKEQSISFYYEEWFYYEEEAK